MTKSSDSGFLNLTNWGMYMYRHSDAYHREFHKWPFQTDTQSQIVAY